MAKVRDGVGFAFVIFLLLGQTAEAQEQRASSPQPENAGNTTREDLQAEEQAEFGVNDTRDLIAGEDVDERVTPNVIPSPDVVRQPSQDLFQVDIGGGLGSYTANLGNALEGGIAWGIRGILGAKAFLGLELGYEGTANSGESVDRGEPLDGPDAVGEPVFGATGEALARINLAGPKAMYRPFIAGGAGYYRLDSDAAALDGLEALSFPLAAGLQMYPYKDLTVGLRGNLRLLTDYLDDDFPTGNQYGGLLTLGTTF